MANIALIVLDTLRKDAFDEHFGWLEGRHYENAYSTANWTGPAHASLFTGEYGSTVGVSSKRRSFDCARDVLPERLRAAGYTTRGWSANPNVSTPVGFDRGFDEFHNPSVLKTTRSNVLDIEKALSKHGNLPKYRRYARVATEAIRSDCDTVASLRHGVDMIRGNAEDVPDDGASAVLRRLRDADFGSDEFLFVNLMEAHTPYYPPEPSRSFDQPVEMPFGEAYFGVDDPALVREGYDAAVRYLSDVYREIFRELSASFEYVFTLSDHGELLGEYGGKWNHVCGIYPELTHVPLVVTGPGFEGRSSNVCSLLDVHATIAELAGVDDAGRGTSLVETRTDRGPYVAEYRGPFPESVEKASEKGMDVEQFDTDLFALIEQGYYGYEDFSGWSETGRSGHDRPTEFLDELVVRYGMRSLETEGVDVDDARLSQLAELGYL